MKFYQAVSATPAMRLDSWNEQLSSLFSNLVADPIEAGDFDGRLAWGSLGAVTCATAWAKRCRMHHGADSDGCGSILLKVQKCGRSHVLHRGRDVMLDPGDMILFDTAKAHRLTLIEDSKMLAISLPKSLLGENAAALEQIAGVRLRANTQAVRHCAAYADNLWRHIHDGDAGDDPEQPQMLAALLLACAPRPASRHRRADWAMVEHHLRSRAFESDLSIAGLSAELGMTPRWLQRIFAAQGTTPGRYVLDVRLEEARRRLADRSLCDTSITTIAFDLGFGDLTYFGRAFRNRYGVPPRGFRKSAGCMN